MGLYARTCTRSRTRPARTLPSPASKNGNNTSPTILSADSRSPSRSSSEISGRVSRVGSGVPADPPWETSASCRVDCPPYVATALPAIHDRSLTGSAVGLLQSFLAADAPPSPVVGPGPSPAAEVVGVASTTDGKSSARHPVSSSNDKLNRPFCHSARPATFPSPLSDSRAWSCRRRLRFETPSVGGPAVFEGGDTASGQPLADDPATSVSAVSCVWLASSGFAVDSSLAESRLEVHSSRSSSLCVGLHHSLNVNSAPHSCTLIRTTYALTLTASNAQHQ